MTQISKHLVVRQENHYFLPKAHLQECEFHHRIHSQSVFNENQILPHNCYYLTFSGTLTANLRAFFYKGFFRNNQILVQEYLFSFLGRSNIKHTHTGIGKKSEVKNLQS